MTNVALWILFVKNYTKTKYKFNNNKLNQSDKSSMKIGIMCNDTHTPVNKVLMKKGHCCCC